MWKQRNCLLVKSLKKDLWPKFTQCILQLYPIWRSTSATAWVGSRRGSRQPELAIFPHFSANTQWCFKYKVQLHELGFEAIALVSPRRMKKGDGTEMGEVVHSTLMPSLLSDQILSLEGETGQGERVTILKIEFCWCKMTLYVNLNCTCQPTEIDSQAWRRNVKVDLKTTGRRTFPLTSRDCHTSACHCGSVPKGSQFQTFQTKPKDALREDWISDH